MSTRLAHATLKERWTEVFGSSPPSFAKADFLQRVVTWNAQIQANGTWRGATGQARLLRLLKPQAAKMALSPGTQLVREWQGVIYQVHVLQSGFEYGGKTYSSLSAIARHITGSARSGPLFFGLKS